MKPDLQTRYQLLHGSDTEAARAELARIKGAGKEVVLVSACLLGVRCRFDGQDREDPAAVARVAGDAELLPVCPEVLARFGVPRPAITLSPDGKVATDARGNDVTAALESGARLADLFATEAGATRALLKERSPSCGTRQVHGPDGVQDGEGRFTARLRKRGLPLVSEEPGEG
ncbi:MAG TPA: DUF523 domain-containing protein [Kofleriaceae bacterium]|nr:DUF523 domain-containing protein [Kofleriaceae bacterium]